MPTKSSVAGLKLDLISACRQMRKNPGLSTTIVVILMFGIGSSLAVFNVLYQAILKPLPYPRAQNLVLVHNLFPKEQVAVAGVSGFDYAELMRRTDVFAGGGLYYYNDLTMTGVGPARHVDVVNASASLFDALGVKPQLGRTFSRKEDRVGAPKTALLSDAFWRGTLGANRNVLGRAIRLDGDVYTVIGVMPPVFRFPSVATQIWIPIALRQNEFTIYGGRLEKWLHMLARVAPKCNWDCLDAGLTATTNRLGSQFPRFYPAASGWRFGVRRLADEQTERFRRWFYLAFAAVICVLLICCVNVGGLLLIQAAARSNELVVRMALGASRLRVLRQVLAETFLLVAAGSIAGLLFAIWAIHLANAYGSLSQPAALEPLSLLFGIALLLLVTAAAGLLPALRSMHFSLDQALRRGATRTSTRGAGWQDAVVALQIALAVVLVFASVALTHSFLKLTRVSAGFEQRNVWTGAVDLPPRNYTADGSWNSRFFEPLLTALDAMPGVESVSGCNAIPFNPSGIWTEPLQLFGKPVFQPPAQAQIGIAFPGYFKTMKIPLLEGREFNERDRAGSQRVAVIDSELARRYFPGEDPVGKLIASGGSSTAARIVGVVASVRNSDLGGPYQPEVYYPELQERSESMYLVLRTSGINPEENVRANIARLDPSVALYDAHTMDERVSGSLKMRRSVAFLLLGLALIGVLLAATGLYASLAHVAQLRGREIAIRVVLGALPARIMAALLARGALAAAIGCAMGIVGAFLTGRALRSELFGVELVDGPTWVAVLAVAAVSAAAAAWWPARRTAHIDPAIALREE